VFGSLGISQYEFSMSWNWISCGNAMKEKLSCCGCLLKLLETVWYASALFFIIVLFPVSVLQ